MCDRMTAMLRAINAATDGAFYVALAQCRHLGATPGFSVEVLDEEAPSMQASDVFLAKHAPRQCSRVRFALAAMAGGDAVAEWFWVVSSRNYDAYRSAIELGVASTLNRVRRCVTGVKEQLSTWEEEDAE